MSIIRPPKKIIKSFHKNHSLSRRVQDDHWPYSDIDIQKAKERALHSLSYSEYEMWCQIERGEI